MQADQVIKQLRAPDQQNMGRVESAESGIDNLDRLSALDAAARTIRVWDSTVIPGNLQTPAYSAAVIQAAHPRVGEMEVRRRVLLKGKRSRVFLRRTFDAGLKTAWFAIGEQAVTRCISMSDEGDMHAVQLGHLLMLSASSKIVIQILPERTVTPGLADQFALYGLDEGHRVGYVETILGSWYSTRLDDVARLHATFSDIARDAMSPQSTRNFIREVLSSWRSARRQSPDSTEESDSSSPRTPAPETTASASHDLQARAPWRTEP